jgi:hypothetical protein
MLDDERTEYNLTDMEIFTTIWTSPRLVFKYINDRRYDKFVIVLLLLSGISRAFDRASLRDMGDKMSLGEILVISIVAGGIFGWMTFYIYAALVSWTGKWLKGKGNTKAVLRMLAYAMLPSVLALVFMIPQIAIYGNEMFRSDGDITSAGLPSNILVYGSMVVEFALGILTIVFCVIGTSEVQKLPIGKSILNLLLPAILILTPFLIIALLFN